MDKLDVVIDTSALLSLKLSNNLEEVLRYFRFFIGNRIREELKEISRTKDALGKASVSILDLVNDSIESVETEDFKRGEKEALWIYREKNMDLLVSDDIEFVKKHENEADFSTILLLVLVKNKTLEKTELIKRLEKIFEKRGWRKNNLIYITTIAELQKL